MDAAALLALRRKARRMEVEVEPGKFVVVEALTPKRAAQVFRETQGKSGTERSFDLAEIGAVGWKGILESDVITSGASDPVDFDADLFVDMLSSKPRWVAEIAEKLMARFEADAKREAEDEKNSATTST